MIRVGHLLPFMGVGGAERLLVSLCRHADRTEFQPLVAAPHDGPLSRELRDLEVPVEVGPSGLARVLARSDVLNLHWTSYDPHLRSIVESAGKPYVTTLHWPSRLPRLPALTICTSPTAREIQPHPELCVAIPNGIDLERFGPRSPKSDGRVVLTRVCRPPRCAWYFWEALRILLDRYPQTELRIVGNDPRAGRTTERVRFLGVRLDVPSLLADSDLFVYTPHPGEGTQDLVTMEASAAGVPCVVSDVECVRDTVLHGVNGFRAPFGDVEAFVECASRLIEDVRLRERMSRQAVEVARQRFDVRGAASAYEEVYRAALEAHAALRGGDPTSEH